ncbi:MAG: hypothetical protein HY717_18775 [Planctomycetes bacterium]|nr:hypothetical protein [Planctomycetota bacterium]
MRGLARVFDRVFGKADAAPAAAPRAHKNFAPVLQSSALDCVYAGGLLLAVPYLLLKGKGRSLVDHLWRRSRDIPERQGSRPCAWVHGVSVGEILSARSFLDKFAGEFPEWEIVLSTTTRAGLEASARQYPGKLIASYPFDWSWLVRRAFDRLRPDLIIIVEHELWPNFLWQARARGVPVALINGRLSERSLKGYRWLARCFEWPPSSVASICVEDEASAAGFQELGVDPYRIHVTGNFKFDNLPPRAAGIRERLDLNGNWVLAAASTHKGEDVVLLDCFAALHRQDAHARLILAPRRKERVGELMEMLRRRGLRGWRWSDASRASWSNGGGLKNRGEVLLVDTFGELDQILDAADVVFVGGSLVPFGGHNIIEPARLGRPVVIGPNYQNFRGVVKAFLERNALVIARDREDLLRQLEALKRDPEGSRRLGALARETVRAQEGASERTIEALRPLIQKIRQKIRRSD